MDYLSFAYELLEVRLKLLQVPVAQLLAKMERGEIFVLNYLLTHEGAVHPKDLSVAMAVSTARIATLLNKLEEKKQVCRCVDISDNRQINVVLTDEGKNRILQVRADVIPQIRSFFEELGPEEALAYLHVQEKMLERYLENK